MVGEQLISWLANEGFGTEATDLYLGSQPEKGNCTTVYEETAPAIDESQAFSVDSIGIQVLCRDESYFNARNQCKAIHKKLSGFRGHFDEEGNAIRKTLTVTAPASIGKDDKDRHEWSAHYNVEFITEDNTNRT